MVEKVNPACFALVIRAFLCEQSGSQCASVCPRALNRPEEMRDWATKAVNRKKQEPFAFAPQWEYFPTMVSKGAGRL